MKRIYLSLTNLAIAAMALGVVVGTTSCGKKGCTDEEATNYDEDAKRDDDSCEYEEPVVNGEETVSGEISSDVTWTSNNIYKLDGKVYVTGGATLTIEAGTIIKGMEGQEASASALIVTRGAKIMAEGTADNPIIFTSVIDDITYGEKVGSNLKRETNELWGGVAILGNAPTSAENGDKVGALEGIPAGNDNGKYGGDNAGDNSGMLKYVSIRHGGISIGEGNELNGLTLAGVGNGTTVENIEIYGTLDDGVECFGGTVNLKNVLVYYQGDDGIDLDQNYSGTIDNFAVIHGDGIGTDEGLEIDGPEGSSYTGGKFTLKNGLCRSEGSDGSAGDFKSGAQGNVQNVTFDYGTAKVKFRTKFDENCSHKGDAYDNLINGDLNFTGVSLDEVSVYDGDLEDGETTACPDELDAAQTAAADKIGSGSGSVDLSTWSWGAAGERGQL